MAYQPKISRARLTLSPFTSEQMLSIGNGLVSSIRARIRRGENANDAKAKPLKPGRNGKRGYPDYKISRGLAPIRDWTWTGRTLRSMTVLSVNENRGTIGFTDARSDRVAHFNNLIEKAFGVSPKDREALNKAVFELFQSANVIQFRRVA